MTSRQYHDRLARLRAIGFTEVEGELRASNCRVAVRLYRGRHTYSVQIITRNGIIACTVPLSVSLGLSDHNDWARSFRCSVRLRPTGDSYAINRGHDVLCVVPQQEIALSVGRKTRRRNPPVCPRRRPPEPSRRSHNGLGLLSPQRSQARQSALRRHVEPQGLASPSPSHLFQGYSKGCAADARPP
jgi:hypothetical protein